MGERRILGCCWGQKGLFFCVDFLNWLFGIEFLFYLLFISRLRCCLVRLKTGDMSFHRILQKAIFPFHLFLFSFKRYFQSCRFIVYISHCTIYISLIFCLFVGGLLFLYALLVQNGKCTVKTKHIKTEKYTLGFRDTHIKIEDTPGKYSFFRLSILRCKIMCMVWLSSSICL